MPDPESVEEVLELASRRRIYDIVKRSAGCHLREIKRTAGLSFGSVSYHLSYLKKHHLIKEEKDGNASRYFSLDTAIQDEKLLMLLRQKSVRTILLFIFSNERCTHQDIVAAARLSPSTATWHLRKLLANGVISEKRRGKYKTYSLNVQKKSIMDLLIIYKESFLDTLVDGLIELWER